MSADGRPYALAHGGGLSKTPSVAAALLGAGADLEAREEGGWAPLHRAATYSATPSVAAALLDAGADPGAKDAGGKIPWDLISYDSPLKGTDAHWQLNQARFNKISRANRIEQGP